MQTNNIHKENEVTQEHLFELLRQAGRSFFTSRQLTELRSEGLLPQLERRSRSGSNKPVYVWNASAVEQALFLYDLLQWNTNHRWVVLPLWLSGYTVDFSSIRQRWLQSLDAYLQEFTCGNPEETYPGDGPEDHVSRVVGRMVAKWKHTPTPYRPEPLQQYGMEAYAQFSEILWNVLLVKEYEVDETTFAYVLASIQGANAGTNTVPPQEDFVDGELSWVKILQEILSIPQVRDVIEHATTEEWEKARLDYMTLSQGCQTVLAPFTQQIDPDGVYPFLFAAGGFFLVPIALAIRQGGYGHWIDTAFAWMDEQLADPGMQAWSARIADPAIQTLLATAEGRAQLMEQLPRLRAEWLGEERK